jgi:2-keto-4-pentenoate hydratase/2-oxohepta-3-ene-1,7-dioic acid hydratase in catechol pathway
MTDFALLNYLGDDGQPVPAIKVDEMVLGIADALAARDRAVPGFSSASTKEVLWGWEAAKPVLADIAGAYAKSPKGRLAKAARPLAGLKLMAPILYPDAIFCAFANFTDHMQEMSGREPPDKTKVKPLHFVKLGAHCVVGSEDEVRLPSCSEQVDWEAELAVVIGKPARNISAADAMSYVAGYTIVNDLSLRDQGTRTDWNVRHDFLSGKSFDTGAPMGPWIVPADQIKDPYDLDMKQWIAGELMQDSNTRFMHFTIAEQIEALSLKFTLRPGDVIATGSPSGNGRPRGIFLEPGQDLLIEIEGIGQLHNPIVKGD